MKVPDIKTGLKRRFVKLRRELNNYILKLKNAPVMHCIGDSHMHAMEYVEARDLMSATRLEFCIVEGATITGLPNPNSKTQAGLIIQQYMYIIKPVDHILLCLGEVDCGFVIWYRCQKYQESVEKHLERAVFNYCELIMLLNQCAPNKVIVCSVPPPTISDQNEWGDVANARSEVKATQLERTNLTVAFNQKISDYCKSNGLAFIDLDVKLIDRNTGIVSNDCLNKNPLDHHLDERMHSRLIKEELNALGFK